MALDRLTQVTSSGITTTISFRSNGINVSGAVTATTFVGDGSGLTGVVGSGSGVVVLDGGSTVGTASTINFGANLSVSPISGGIVTVTGSSAYANSDVDTHLNTSTASSGEVLSWNGSDYDWVAQSGGSSDVVSDTTPQLGGNLDLNSKNITGTGNVNITGVITATSFSGTVPSSSLSGALPALDGSALTGITAAGSGVVVQEEGSNVGTAATINFVGSDVTATFSGGVATVTVSSSGISDGDKGDITVSSSGATWTIDNDTITNAKMADDAIGLAELSATGTPSASNYLRGDNTWATITTGITDVVSDTTPQLGGNLDLNSNNITGTGNVNVTGIVTASLSNSWTLTGNGSAYFFSGAGFDGTETNPTVYLVRGQRYRFNSSGAHPFRIQATSGASGTVYSDGVTNNNSAAVDFNVQNDAPDVLFYQCTNHSGMAGKIYISGKVIASGSWTAVAGTPQTIDTISGISTNNFKTAEYTIHIENGSNFQAQKVLAMQNGTNAFSQEYAVMYETSLLVGMGVTISSGNFELRATPESGISGVTTYRFTRETMQ
jgi:hypothetical protein